MSLTPKCNFKMYMVDRIVCLEDLDEEGDCSVTNDADAAVDYAIETVEVYWRKPFDRIIYRDSMGVWDELKVKDGRFAGFGPLRETDRERAIAKLRILRVIQ